MASDDLNDRADGEPGPEKEPKKAKAWLDLIVHAEKVFRDYQDRSDNIDKRYADLSKLADSSRDRQFQIFWANVAVIGPSIYSRTPVPVVVPRFKNKAPVPRITSELLERCMIVLFEQSYIDAVMRQIRDDLTVLARGCAWIRYEAKDKDQKYLTERVCIEYVDRKDFVHDPARTWEEVDWVAKASYLDQDAMRKRFKGVDLDNVAYTVRKKEKGAQADDKKLKAKVWEIWCKSLNRVVWVTEGCEELLDDDKPHLDLAGFFPCPKPAYGTVQRRTLIPVPDMVFYKDQLEEINEITARLSALTQALKVRGFYPAGAGEIGDAIEAAIKSVSDNAVMVPISNWAMLGGGAAKDMIVWLPIEVISTTITELVALRKQLIDDVYQITGISDIMRGDSEASETLGAQQLKSQYGSIRIRDRQYEMVRMALDITRIAAEIMAENFQSKTLLEMSQLEIPTDQEVKAQVTQLQAQAQQMIAQAEQIASNPQAVQLAQQNPEEAKQLVAQAQGQVQQLQAQIAKLEGSPTVEKVMSFLRDQKIRPFILDIETDSTIAPDENAQKQRATEFVTAVGTYLSNAMPMVQQVPQSAKMAAEVLKYVASQFRAGRELETTIEEFADQIANAAGQAQGQQTPEQMAAQAEAQALEIDMQMKQQEAQQRLQEAAAKMQLEIQKAKANDERVTVRLQADLTAKQTENQMKLQQMQATDAREAQKHVQEIELGQLNIELLKTKINQSQVQTEATVETTKANIEANARITDAGIMAQQAKAQASEARP